MPNPKNIQQVQDISSTLEKSKAVYLVDTQGLTANQIGQLRTQIREVGGQLQVVKNSLFARALNQLKPEHQLSLDTHQLPLAGTTAALFATEDEIQPLKVTIKFAKDTQLPKLKMGLFNHQLLGADQVERLANLPTQTALRGQVVGMLASPIARLVGSLNSTLVKFVIALEQIRLQKSAQM